MPCQYYSDSEIAAQHLADLNQLTQILCELCATGVPLTLRVSAWWTEHQAQDALRLKQEAARQQQDAERQAKRKAALACLTPEQRAALNLRD